MAGAAASIGSFYPKHVLPSPKPLRFPFNISRLLTNNLSIIPEEAYSEPLVIAPGPPRMAFITGPELVKELLFDRPTEFPKGAVQVDVLKPIFGNAMLSQEGHEWRWQRNAAAPLFRHDELVHFGSVMSAAAETAVAKWKRATAGSVHAIQKDMMRAAFNVITNTMLAGGADEIYDAIEKGHTDYYAGINWWIIYTLFGLPHWLPRPGGQAMRAHETRLRDAVSELVRSRGEAATADHDLLARMLRAVDPETGQGMSRELVVDNIVSFLMAGYDTTALALAWSLYLISQSPDWETRMLDEINRVAGSGPITSDHVEKLKIVQQVVNESLRLFPTAPIILRDFKEDVTLGGIVVPRGTIGIIPIYAIHRHSKYWEDPHQFNPARFAREDRSKLTRFHFMPFGVGPRICIGAAFAMLELTIMLATFVRAARFEIDPGFDPSPSGRMFLVPEAGMPMKITLREHDGRST
jgi:cytochrome P450